MHVNKHRVLARCLILSLAFGVPINSQASGYAVISVEDLVKMFTHICVIDVNKVNYKENTQTFRNNQTRVISRTSLVSGNVVESLKGDCGTGTIQTRYTTPKSVEYNEDGEIRARYTLLQSQSFNELKVQPNKRYLFGYRYWNQDGVVKKHARVDFMAELQRVQAAIDLEIKKHE